MIGIKRFVSANEESFVLYKVHNTIIFFTFLCFLQFRLFIVFFLL